MGTDGPESPSEGLTMTMPRSADGALGETLDGTSSGERITPSTSLLPQTAAAGRYRAVSEIGRGGMGVVRRMRDSLLGRDVAEKRLLGSADERARLRFLEEARATAQLEHPSIVPVYDLLEDGGEATFTMRLVGGRSLREIITALRLGDLETTKEYGTTALLVVFLKICDAVAYAHSRGVLHRDLKPENVMLGRFGEVFVMDWGLARVRGAAPTGETSPTPTAYALDSIGDLASVVSVRDSGVALTNAGAILGTPGYMAPEQIRGEPSLIGPPADVFSLGAILYEILSLVPAIGGKHAHARLVATLVDTIPRLGDVAAGRVIPGGLEDVVARALARETRDRIGSVDELQAAVRGALEGSERAARKREAALAKLALARAAFEHHREDQREHDAAFRARAGRVVRLDDAIARRALFHEDAAIERLALKVERSFWDAYTLYSGATADDPSVLDARSELLDLLLVRAEEIQRQGERVAARTLVELARRHDPEGAARRLDAEGRIDLMVDAEGATASVSRFVREGPITIEARFAEPDFCPRTLSLPPGSYVADLAAAGRAPVRVPFEVRPLVTRRLEVSPPPAEKLLPGFVVVPGGSYPMGGDPRAPESEPARHVELATFAIATHLVTVAEYGEFLNALPHDEALSRAPRVSGVVQWTPGADGRWSLPFVDHEGDAWLPDWPVVMVSALDADVYAAWFAARTGAPVRLPSSDEWEAAMRGTSDRVFPWGDGFDPSLAWNLAWTGGAHGMQRVASRPLDRSLFGLMDAAGLVREWTTSADGAHRKFRSGAWQATGDQLRIGRVSRAAPERTYVTIGLRLAHEL